MKKLSIFIVEDYLLARLGLKHALEMSDFEVTGAFESAEKCIEALNSQKPDVILMDLGLPNMNGIEATKVIKTNFPEIKIVILTSHEKEHEVLACLASNANAYCLKEIASENLYNVIKMVHEGALWLDPKIAQIAYKFIPAPKSTDIGNLYEDNSKSIKLTEREYDVLRLLVEGKSNTEIAKEIIISPHTAKAHVGKILEKFAVSDRVQAAVKAIKYNLV